jgi:hypothetical protein
MFKILNKIEIIFTLMYDVILTLQVYVKILQIWQNCS